MKLVVVRRLFEPTENSTVLILIRLETRRQVPNLGNQPDLGSTPKQLRWLLVGLSKHLGSFEWHFQTFCKSDFPMSNLCYDEAGYLRRVFGKLVGEAADRQKCMQLWSDEGFTESS